MTRLLLIAFALVAPALIVCLYLAAAVLLCYGFGGGHWWGFVGGIALLLLASAIASTVGTL